MSAASPRLKVRKSIGNAARRRLVRRRHRPASPFASPSESTISRPGRSRGIRLAASPIAPPRSLPSRVHLLHELGRLAELLGQPFDARLAAVRHDADAIAGRPRCSSSLTISSARPRLSAGIERDRSATTTTSTPFAAERRQRHRRKQRDQRGSDRDADHGRQARATGHARSTGTTAGRSGAAARGRAGDHARSSRGPRPGASRHQLATIAVPPIASSTQKSGSDSGPLSARSAASRRSAPASAAA